MFRLPETFALTRRRFRDFRPLIPTNPYASPSHCAPHHALARRACDAGARKAAKRVSTPRPAPPYSYSRVSRETCEDHPRQQRESPTAPGLTLSLRSLVSASLRRRRSWRCRASEPFLPHSRVSRETTEHGPVPARAPPPRGLSCPRSERSSSPTPPAPAQLRLRRRTHYFPPFYA